MKVDFYELRKDQDLAGAEKALNRALEGSVKVRLFRDQSGRVGYSLHGLRPDAGRQALLSLHAAVAKALGWSRGRPRGEATRQVKFRIPESAYQALSRLAARRSVSPSRLAGELVLKQLD